ncbi:acyltransferase [soil metagenome]
MERSLEKSDRVRGLDSIRFICAFVVFMGHGGAPRLFGDVSGFREVVSNLYTSLWAGPAAVIVFFVISGFCIHYPFADSAQSINLPSFYARRFLRILIPMAVIIPIAEMRGLPFSKFNLSILWSLVAEMVYYLIYPALRKIHGAGWGKAIAIAYVAAAIMVVTTHPEAMKYNSFQSFNWLLGLPCWLLGCWLADRVKNRSLPQVTSRVIWQWRVAVVVAAVATHYLFLRSLVGFPWTLNLFALLATAWLMREIAYGRTNPPLRMVESAGLWSYSLYLVHEVISDLFGFTSIRNPIAQLLVADVLTLVACYAFYLVVERPSHHVARSVARDVTAATESVRF